MRSEVTPESHSPSRNTVFIRLLDVHGVAEMLGLSERSVWRRVEDGDLPQPIYIGRLAKWRVADIEEYINRKFQEANSAARNLRGRPSRHLI